MEKQLDDLVKETIMKTLQIDSVAMMLLLKEMGYDRETALKWFDKWRLIQTKSIEMIEKYGFEYFIKVS